MAMSKKEAAAFEALQQEVRLVKALRWTEEVATDVAPPERGQDHRSLSKGWLHNSYSGRVERSCSSSHSHAFGNDDKTTSQQSRWLYSTRKLAFQAMRNEVERKCADNLARIDAEIEKCE